MGTFTTTVYSSFLEKEAEGDIDLSTDVITAHLTNAAPNATTHDELPDITEIATGGGYTQLSGLSVSVLSSSLNGANYECVLTGTIGFTATGTVAQFRYVVLCFSSLGGDPLFCYLDLGTAVDLTTDDVLSVDVDNVVIYKKTP